jgi:hypothetical protein
MKLPKSILRAAAESACASPDDAALSVRRAWGGFR